MKTTFRAVLIGSTLLLACGGSSKPAAVEPARASSPVAANPAAANPTQTPVATPAVAPAEPAKPELLAIGPAKITVVYEKKHRAEISIAADGAITANVQGAKGKKQMKQAMLMPDGTLRVERKVIAKLDDDGTISFLAESVEKFEGKVVKSESRWEPVGTLEDDGTFTATKDGKQLTIAADGKVVGFPKDLEATIEAADPAHRRGAMIMVISMFAGGKVESDTSSSSAPAMVNP